MLNQVIGTMIAGGVVLIGAVVTIDPGSERATNSLASSSRSDVVVPLPFLTDDTGMRMRAIYRKPDAEHKIVSVQDKPAGNATSLTVISPYLTPVALRMAMRAGWAFPDEEGD